MMLKLDNYAMADMLVISDFFFDLPNFQVMKAMQEEHEKGTRFYGLQIGRGDCEYDTILDKVWKI